MKRVNPARAGFSLPTVILIMAVTALAAAILLDIVSVDFAIQRTERVTLESRTAAEGGLHELLNDQRLQSNLPEFDDPGMSQRLSPGTDSEFAKDGAHYEGEVRLLRMAPVSESSQGKLQAVMYELVVDSQVEGGGRSGVRAEIYKYVSTPRGLIQEGRHAR